ncbi:hypothetical protein [Delftia acidovorans]|uniref:Uncharacterized protein n=1 Tax=Delftia acidovorans TaxID=80866 RepID=A0AAJ2R8Y8_DELAC|nr:hypothetical protein [Delftia acidovorans]MDX4957924.1 hypothetical protein [Delftia acidovorans]
MKTAWLNLRYSIPERIEAFRLGLERHGFTVRHGISPAPGTRDLLVTWNRVGQVDQIAGRYGQVLAAENAAWGNGLAGRRWISLARDRHNTAGMFPVGGSERWDGLSVELQPWRTEGEAVLLPQRGIGSAPTAMPRGWLTSAQACFSGRVRPHPGRCGAKPLREDLAHCGRVVTWGSGAAVQALMWGIPVISEMPDWIGAQDNTDAGRLEMFRRMAWAQWTLQEVAAGVPFERLL